MWRGDTWVIGFGMGCGCAKGEACVEVSYYVILQRRRVLPALRSSNASLFGTCPRATAPRPHIGQSGATLLHARAIILRSYATTHGPHMTMHAGFGGTSTSSFSLTSSIIFASSSPGQDADLNEMPELSVQPPPVAIRPVAERMDDVPQPAAMSVARRLV